MINKTGASFRILKTAAAIADLQAPPLDLQINKVIEPKRSDAIYFRARAISAGDQGPKDVKWNYNGNYDYFARKELEAAFSTFNGRNLFINHDTTSPLKAVGKVLDSYPVTDPDTGEFYIECLARVDRALHPELAGMIENGDLNSVSMGASCGASMCSVCGHMIYSDQDNRCMHMGRLGQEFDAEISLPDFKINRGDKVPAFCINSHLTFSELSIVSVPADSAALIKTVIAGFKNRLVKIGSKHPEQATQALMAELEVLFGLLPIQAREDIKKQICASIGACNISPTEVKDNQMDKVSNIQKEAAAYDLLVWALSKSADATMATTDLFQAMQDAEFAVGRTQEGKPPERQVFYNALHAAQSKGWITQVEQGVYTLTESGKQRAVLVSQILGEVEGEEITPPGKGKINEPKDMSEPSEAVVPSPEEVANADTQPVSAPEAPAPAAHKVAHQEVKPESKLDKKYTPEVESVLGKLSGLEYEHLSQHILSKSQNKDSSNVVQVHLTKVAAEPAPAMEIKMDEPKMDMPKAEPAKGPSEDIAGEASDVKKLEQAEKLIKEVKEHEKEELKDLKDKEPEAPTFAEAPGSEMAMPKKATIKAVFTRKPLLSRSFWTVFADDKPVLTANLKEICGEYLPQMKTLVTSAEYGTRLLQRIQTDGLQKVADLIGVKASDEAMDHLRGKEWNTGAREKGFNDVRKMQEGAERSAEPSRKGVDRPYGEPGDHLKAQANIAKEAEANEGRSPKVKDMEGMYEKAGSDVHKAHEANERSAEPSRKNVDRPYGEPGDHLKAQAAKEVKAAEEKGFSPAMKDHQSDYEKGQQEVKKSQEGVGKAMDTPPHMRVQTSYEAGEHLSAEQKTKVTKSACHCGEATCACPCDAGQPCICKTCAKCTGMPKAAGKGEMSGNSPKTLTESEKGAISPAGPHTGGTQDWDAGKNLFNSNKVESEEAKAKEIGVEALPKVAKLEPGEKTLSESEGPKAHPAGSATGDMKPVSMDQATKEIGGKDKTNHVEAKLEPGEKTLSETEKIKDEFKPKMGSEKVESDETKEKAVGSREEAHRLEAKLAELESKLKAKEAILAEKEAALVSAQIEHRLEAKMNKCKKLVAQMVEKDMLAVENTLVEKYVKEGHNLLDARQEALRETVDKQLAAFMQMPDNVLQVQAETFARIKKSASAPSNHLRIGPTAKFEVGGEDDWMKSLPWS